MAVLADHLRTEEVVVKDANPWLAQRLLRPEFSISFEQLYDFFGYTEVTFVCEPTRVFEQGDWLIAALRGAWGRALMDQAERSENRGQNFQWVYRPDATTVFFRDHVYAGNAHVPKPYVFRVSRDGALVKIHLTLFGWANMWRDDAIAAMFQALEVGISLRERGRLRMPWTVVDWHWQWHDFTLRRPVQNKTFLFFETPLRLGGGERMTDIHQELVYRLSKRVRLLARWNGVEVDFDPAQVFEACQDIRCRTLSPQYVTRYLRRSSRRPDVNLHMVGVRAILYLKNIPDELWPVLDIGEICHVGSQTSFGFGKYRI